MNLHIVPDSGIVDAFYSNLEDLGILANNKMIISTRLKIPRYSKKYHGHAHLYSSEMNELIGDTAQYEGVFIHQFSPLMYRWVATHDFNKLYWLVWGADLYNLPFVNLNLYEPLTKKAFAGNGSFRNFFYLLKVALTNSRFRARAYAKVDFLLTWMESEFEFATVNIPHLKASHKHFFYENQSPFYKLDHYRPGVKRKNPQIIVGNSGFATNNHLDAIHIIIEKGIKADLVIPVSYGDKDYIRFLKKNIPRYENGRIKFIERYMGFEEYVSFLSGSDALVMNTIRPQGYGNILMMLYMNKPVLINDRNISLVDLTRNGINCGPISEIDLVLNEEKVVDNRAAVENMFSHKRLIQLYRDLFSST